MQASFGTEVTLSENPRLRQKQASQWFTPRDLSERLVRWAGDLKGQTVLEPSAGSGRILEHIERAERVDAIELDPKWAAGLETMAAEHPCSVAVECCDYMKRPAPAERYGLSLMNPPYEGGLDGLFVEKAMAESERVIALVRSAFLHGAARHSRVWSQTQGPNASWSLIGIAYLVGRPSFSAGGEESGSPLSDFIAIKLARDPGEWWRRQGGTLVEWW